tara:strand:- start:43 stop:351 length:309 start_codon:yes stop_codon:yes gene_type:complete
MSTFFPKIGVFNPVRGPKDYGVHIPKFKISFSNILDKGVKVHNLPAQEAQCDSIENETLCAVEKETHREDIEARIQKVASKWEISIKDATELIRTVDSAQSS